MIQAAGTGTLHEIFIQPHAFSAAPMVHWLSGFPGAELVLIAMAFAWGAILGSFVNVVIHRVPRGESVVTHGSRCPACGAGIRARDNIPIFGWLMLRGRCRDCGVAISAGYPAIEAGCGVIASIIAAAELAGVGSPSLASARPGVDRLLAGDWRIALAWAMHTVIPVAMLAWNLTGSRSAGDAHATARGHGDNGCRAAAAFVAAAIATVTVVPGVGPPGVWVMNGGPPSSTPGWQVSCVASCLGAVAGRLAGAVTARPGDRCGLATFGAAAGWQAVVIVTVMTAVIRRLVASMWTQGLAARAVAAAAPAAAAMGLFAAWTPVSHAWAECWRRLLLG